MGTILSIIEVETSVGTFKRQQGSTKQLSFLNSREAGCVHVHVHWSNSTVAHFRVTGTVQWRTPAVVVVRVPIVTHKCNAVILGFAH